MVLNPATATLEEILGQELNVTALRFFSQVAGGFSGNEIARRTGINQSSMRKALERLVDLGVLSRSDIGRAARYELNTKRAVVSYCVLDLFRSEQALRELLIENVRNRTGDLGPGVTSVVLYGSVARGDRTWRDVDLLILADARARRVFIRRKLQEADEFIRDAFGIPLSVRILRPSQLFEARGRRLLHAIEEEGIQLHGGDLPVDSPLPRRMPKRVRSS